MKPIYCLLLILCPYLGNGQEHKPALSVGQHLPDISFSSLLNHNTPAANLYAFKSRLLILDFWATWCTACLKKFPLLDSMQQAYPADFKALLINAANTNDTRARIEKTFARIRTNLPTVVADTQALAFFPHQHLPHYVWLDSSFRILAITGSDMLTAHNIKTAIRQGSLLAETKADQPKLDPGKILFTSGHTLIYQSSLSGRLPGLSSATYRNAVGDTVTSLKATNMSTFSMLLMAYATWPPLNRVVVETNHPQLFVSYNADDSVLKQNSFCYELLTPPLPKKQAYELMQQDIHRYFNLRLKKEERLRPVYVLKANESLLQKHLSQGAPPVNELGNPANRHLVNQPVQTLADYLNRYMALPVINEVRFSSNINLQLGAIGLGVQDVNEALQSAGLCLEPAQRTITVYTIY